MAKGEGTEVVAEEEKYAMLEDDDFMDGDSDEESEWNVYDDPNKQLEIQVGDA